MRHEKQDIDQEGEQGHQECWQEQNEESQEEARRMGRAMEVGRGGQTQANEGEEGSDGMYDQDRR